MAGEDAVTPEMLAAMEAATAKKLHQNQTAALAFTGSMAAIALFFVILHMASRLGQTKSSPFTILPRSLKSFLTRKAPAVPSAGHAVVVFLYFSINVIIAFTNVNTGSEAVLSSLGARMGWMAIGNMVLVTFLALKNTPLAYLVGRSYEQLNILHQIAGYTTIGFISLHAILYCSSAASHGRLPNLIQENNIFGIFAASAFLVLGISGLIIRHWWYELFYYFHITFWMIAIIMVGNHQPNFAKKIIFATMVAAGIWALDRLIRMARLAVYSANNFATLTPLPHGGTRVTITKPPVGATSGRHCFLWIPAIRFFEMHPFTIAATTDGHLEFVVASYDGFTRDLHDYAVEHPGASLKASIEGSYGAFPEPANFDKVVLVAGGSGASFTFGMALNMLSRIGDNQTEVVFLWMVKDKSYIKWFAHHLETLVNDKRVTVQLFVTRASQTALNSPVEVSREDINSKYQRKPAEKEINVSPDTSIVMDAEKSLRSDGGATPSSDESSWADLPVVYTRPDVSAILRSRITETPFEKRVLVLGCGPDKLMTEVRNTTAECIRGQGPSVELHCEQFGW